jgi:hypothetical protein
MLKSTELLESIKIVVNNLHYIGSVNYLRQPSNPFFKDKMKKFGISLKTRYFNIYNNFWMRSCILIMDSSFKVNVYTRQNVKPVILNLHVKPILENLN